MINDGTTIIAVTIKNIPQSPLSQSTRAPDDEANVVFQQYQLKLVKHTELPYRSCQLIMI